MNRKNTSRQLLNTLALTAILITAGLLTQCGHSQTTTPVQFKNKVKLDPITYSNHIAELHESIANLIKTRSDPHYQLENDSLTDIFIDTILYSPTKMKFAFFAITANSNIKLLTTTDKAGIRYSAHCFIGLFDQNKKIKDFKWVRGYNISNFTSHHETSTRIREVYLAEMTQRENENGESTYKYNLDDVRFWEGPLWHTYY